MLKILTDKDLPNLLSFCDGSILGTRIACYALCYGFDKDFLMFWADEDYNCIAAKFDNSLTVVANDNSDVEELRKFIDIIGADTVTVNEDIAKALNYSEFDTKKGFKYMGNNNPDFSADIVNEADLKEIYTLISKAIPNSFANTKEAYLSFVSDFTYRRRRGFATGKCIHHDEKVVSSAITAAQSKNSALISGVACYEEYRKFGYGKRTVLNLAEELKTNKKEVFVIALNTSAEGFYEHIGFTECGKIAFIKRKV